MERLLVGVDGSAYSLHALKWAANIAGRGGLELFVARVRQGTTGASDGEAASGDGELRDVEELCASLPDRCERRRALLLDGDPPEALLKALNEHDADVLVVGSRGSGGFGHLHIGSVAHDLLHLTHLSTAPLAVVPPTAALAVKRIVVGNDFSPGSAAAIELTATMAKLLGVPVTAVYSAEPAAEQKWDTGPRGWRRRAETEVRAWAAPIEAADASVDVYVDRDRQVHPVAALEYVLQRDRGSVAVLGTRGLGGFSGLRLGRVPLQLVHHTGHAVVLVPPPHA